MEPMGAAQSNRLLIPLVRLLTDGTLPGPIRPLSFLFLLCTDDLARKIVDLFRLEPDGAMTGLMHESIKGLLKGILAENIIAWVAVEAQPLPERMIGRNGFGMQDETEEIGHIQRVHCGGRGVSREHAHHRTSETENKSPGYPSEMHP